MTLDLFRTCRLSKKRKSDVQMTPILIFTIGSLTLLITVLFALRRGKRRTKLKIGAVLGFIVILFFAHDRTDMKTAGIAMGLAILIAIPFYFLIRKHMATLNKIPKETNMLLIVTSLFFWQWIHTASVLIEVTLALLVGIILLSIAFTFEDKDLALDDFSRQD
jgi:drug/metabolite transporter (DMT)-like permease